MKSTIKIIEDKLMIEAFLLTSVLNHTEVDKNKMNFLRDVKPIARRIEEKVTRNLSKQNKVDTRTLRKEYEEIIEAFIKGYKEYSLNGIETLDKEQKKDMLNVLKTVKINKDIFEELLITENYGKLYLITNPSIS